MYIKFVIKKHINNTKNEICCLLTYQVRSQLCKFPSFQFSETAAFLDTDLSLWFSWGSRFECQPGLTVGHRTRVMHGQGWRLNKLKAEPWPITLREASEINLSTWSNWKKSRRLPVTGILRWSSGMSDPNQQFHCEHNLSTREGFPIINAYSLGRPWAANCSQG